MYEELKSFFDRLGDHLSTSPDGVLNVNKDLELCFMPLAEQFLFRNSDLMLESARTKRAQASLSFTILCEQAKVVVPDSQRRLMADWLLKERSGQVQTVLRQVVKRLEVALT